MSKVKAEAFCPSCGNYHPVIHHACCANARAERDEWKTRGEEAAARVVHLDHICGLWKTRAEKAEAKLLAVEALCDSDYARGRWWVAIRRVRSALVPPQDGQR